EQLGDLAGEVRLDFLQRAIRVDDSPDRLDQAQALVPGEALAEKLREVEEVHALLPLLLGEEKDLVELVLRNVHLVTDVARDAVALLGAEDVVRVGDLQKQRASRDRDRVRTHRLDLLGLADVEEGEKALHSPRP